jgi:hypothetical protein
MKLNPFSNSLRVLCSLLVGAALTGLLSGPVCAATFNTYADAVSSTYFLPQRVVWVGEGPPAEEESKQLLDILQVWRDTQGLLGLADLEMYLAAYANSPWAPSLHANLALHYRSRGQTSVALEHWEDALVATKDYPAGDGKKLADLALAHWSRLLMVLGRTDLLAEVYQVYGNRVLDNGPLTQMWIRTHEKHLRMLKYPYDSYKCGIYALDQVAQAQALRHYSRSALLRTPSKPQGMSLRELQSIAGTFGLGLKAVRRAETSGSIVVPSVVHWRLEHYAAIKRQRGDLYEVADPSGQGVLWLTADEINAEASGYFLIPAAVVHPGFGGVPPAEAAQVFGRASSCPPEDPEDALCPTCTCPPGTQYCRRCLP